jgi:hypothetical protein
VCIARDDKGFYSQTQRGDLKGFTGVDDPYEPPLNPELVLDTVDHSPEANAALIIDYLIKVGLLLQNEDEAFIHGPEKLDTTISQHQNQNSQS